MASAATTDYWLSPASAKGSALCDIGSNDEGGSKRDARNWGASTSARAEGTGPAGTAPRPVDERRAPAEVPAFRPSLWCLLIRPCKV